MEQNDLTRRIPSEPTTMGEKLGYGIADYGAQLVYVLTSTYLLYFLTTVADIAPAAAGAITVIAAVWNALINPVVGYISDNIHSKLGRRRPLMLAASVPLGILTMLLYTDVGFTGGLKIVYYAVLLLLFWTAFDFFFVPYYALGADYTTDYHDRVKMRLVSSFFIMLANIIAMSTPPIIVAMLEDHGLSKDHSWTITSALMGAMVTVTILITFFASKGKDIPLPKEEKAADHSFHAEAIRFFKEYFQIAMLKPMKPLILVSLFVLIPYVMIHADLIYLLTYNMGFQPGLVSLFMMLQVIPGFFFIPITDKLVKKFDKKGTMIAFYVVSAVLLIVLRLTFAPSYAWIICYLIVSAIVTYIYWQIIPACYYDVCEYDYAENGVKREAAIVSFQGFIEAIAEGLGAQVLGLLLQFGGFDGNSLHQGASALSWICSSATIVPVIFIIAAMIAMHRYPINRKVYEKILEKQKENEASYK